MPVDPGDGDGEVGERGPQVLQPVDRSQRLLDGGRLDGFGERGRRPLGEGPVGGGRLPRAVVELQSGFLGQAGDGRPHVHGPTLVL
ncbi:hypothetical protein ACGFX4_16100 [Kitasatospora sp. NPDC048365]|uniref:hypothetical protein n=1 Tax=Kitasatospora sp. NPDC048365 TaxID=3364050 RepID=UPI00371D3C25